MQTLILPGYSASNKEWVDQTVKSLNVDHIVRPFYWMHWTDETSKFDAEEKARLIVKHIKKDKINIIAKSLGILVAATVIKMVPGQIKKGVFCGIPLKDLSGVQVEFVKNICLSHKDILNIIQNSNDPHGTFDEVVGFGKVLRKPASDHNYFYFDDINRLLI